jgi:hypothetical protein
MGEHIGADHERVADDRLCGEPATIDDGLDGLDDHVGNRCGNARLDSLDDHVGNRCGNARLDS